MKKLITAIIVVTMLASCKKENAITEPELRHEAKAKVTREQVNDSTGSYDMQFRVFNCVTNEYVSINGHVTYTYKDEDSRIYFSQIITMTGTGETSGLSYSGSSREVGTTTRELDYLNEWTTTGGTNYRNFTITNANGVRYTFTYYNKYTIDSEGYFHNIVEKIVDPC